MQVVGSSRSENKGLDTKDVVVRAGRMTRHPLVILGLVVFALMGLLALTGVPEPLHVRTRHVGRVNWTSLWKMAVVKRERGEEIESDGWLPGRDGLLVHFGFGPGTKRLLLARPEDEGERVKGIPPNVTRWTSSSSAEQPIVVYLVPEGPPGMFRAFRWNPGTGEPAVAITAGAEALTSLSLRADGTLLAGATRPLRDSNSELFVMDPRHPSTRRAVADVQGRVTSVVWSPDGGKLLVLTAPNLLSTIPFLVYVATGKMTRVAEAWGDTVSVTAGVWAEDGRSLYLVSDAGSDYKSVQRVESATGVVTNLTKGLKYDVVDMGRVTGTETLIVMTSEEGRQRLYSLDGATQRLTALPAPAGNLRSIGVHPSKPWVFENVHQDDGRDLIAVLNVATGSLETWKEGAPPPQTPVPAAETVAYPTFDTVDGKPRQIDLVLKKPIPQFPAPWPVLIVLHAGPSSQAVPEWDRWHSVFQREGIAVLQPNVRGSTGFGKTFESLDNGRKREDAVKDVGALLDWLKTQKDLDASRVAVVGASYGGYLTLATMTHYSSQLRCGAELFGVSDFPDMVKDAVEGPELDAQRLEFGDERDPAMKAYMDSISPIHHLDRITVPLLVFQGTNDSRVHPRQSLAVVEKLEEMHKPVKYIETAEAHTLSLPLDRLYFGAVMVDELHHCLELRH